MTLNFDGGDILILLLVGIALFLFRRFDKTGRSLEKVRRYADKSKGELDAIVRERELGLKDLAVDLEVQEQTNREILLHAESARDEILAKSHELEDRVEKMESHERALEDLNDLALRVDENLRRLKEESVYVDQVGTRLSDVREKFSAMASKDEARFDSFRTQALKTFENELSAVRDGMDDTGRRLAVFRESLEELNARRDEEAAARLAVFRDNLESAESEVRGHLENVVRQGRELDESARVQVESLRTNFDTVEAEYVERLNQLNAEGDKFEEAGREKTAALRKDFESVEEEFRDRLRKVADEGERLEDDAFNALNERIASRVESLECNWMGGMNELKDRVAETDDDIRSALEISKTSLERWETDSSGRMESLSDEFTRIEEKLSETSGGLDRRLKELRGRLDGIVDAKETDLLETVELRQTEYRKVVEDRFENLEQFIRDMDGTAESLRAAQSQTIRSMEDAFASFGEEMTERRDLEKARVEEEADALRGQMAGLEKGLDQLKSRAYDNVSEKLQVFEDEFFADLRSRDTEMRAAMDEWRKNADLEMGEMGLKASREREETERRCSMEIKQKLSDLQTRVFGQFGTFQDQVDGFRDALAGRMRTAEDDIAAFRRDMTSRITREKDASAEEFEKAFRAFDKETVEKFAKANKVIGQKLSDCARDIDTRYKELQGAFQAARDESVEWKERMDVIRLEAENESAAAFGSLKSEMGAMISEIQDGYSGKTEQLILESGESRAALRRDLVSLEESVARLGVQVVETSRDGLEALREESENFLLEFRKNIRDSREEMERKSRELRQVIQDARYKAESNRKEMLAHTDTEHARLMRNLDEIDRRQREFIAETRVFERADEMKEQLEADISELALRLEDVGAGQEEIRTINEQYEKAVGLYEDVSSKMARFLSEQQKVENLEGKIARIASLSESVDLKLNRVGEANDALQDLQVRLKQLEDLHEDLGTRYERLADKSSVLDTTTQGVDKSFERMSAIETAVRDFAERMVPLRANLSEAEERQAVLDGERERIDAVVQKVSTVDTTLEDLDRRFEELGKAREWLARTETRLEEINNETQQKVRLLGSLSKRESGGRKNTGSPDMSTREVVVKLAREGWSSEEIARTTKLSRGEVELILELTPNS